MRGIRMAGSLALAVLAGATLAEAQTGSIHGQVADTAGRVLVAAIVEVPELGIGALSDSSGLFRFDSIPVATYLVRVAIIGFEDDSVRVDVRESGSLVRFRLDYAPPLYELDVTPRPFEGGLLIGLFDQLLIERSQPQLKVVLETEHHFPITGTVIDAVVSRSEGLLRLEILGAHRPSRFGGATMTPAMLRQPLDLSPGRVADTLEIAYQGDSDRYLVWRTETHAFIKPIEASFTVLPADSLELANPGTMRIRCHPAGYPVEDCEDFLSDLLPLGVRSERLTRRAETSTRVFGNTLSRAGPQPAGRWLLFAHGVVETDIERVLSQARTFTGTRDGRAGARVEVATWDGRRISCYEGGCR